MTLRVVPWYYVSSLKPKLTQRPLNNNVLTTTSAFRGYLLLPYVSYKDFQTPSLRGTTRLLWAALTIRNGQKHTRRNSKDSRTEEFLRRSGHPKELRSLEPTRVSIIKSIMVYWINKRSACVLLGIINRKTASMLLIYILSFWKLPKLGSDYWQQSQQNMVARYWRLTQASISVRKYGRRQGISSTAWLVAKAYSWRSCSLTSQKHLWHQASSTKVAHFISGWMEKNGYPVVNSQKTIFMKRQGDDFIIHCLFVDDVMHIPTCGALKQEFMEKYTKDFNITGGSLEIYLGMQVEQSPGKIRLHLNYIRGDLGWI